MKKDITCQDSKPPHLHPLSRMWARMRGNFTLTSSLKFSINSWRHSSKGIIGYEKVPGDLSSLRQKR
jgi:hypothetical protein